MAHPPFSLSRLALAVLACLALAAGCFVVAILFGEQSLDFSAIRTPDSVDQTIFFSLRLPRVVLACIVGAALASSGSMLQSLTRNPLADPFVLGVSGGSALGATIAPMASSTTAAVVASVPAGSWPRVPTSQ